MLNEFNLVAIGDFSDNHDTSLLVANESGEVVDRRPLDVPQSNQNQVAIMLPEAFGAPIIGNTSDRITLPNPTGSVILPSDHDTLIGVQAGGFDQTVSRTAIIGKVAAQQEYRKRIDDEVEARERAKEEAARQHDIDELTNSPGDFLLRKARRKLAVLNEEDVSRDVTSGIEPYLTILSVIHDPYIQRIKGDENLYVALSEIVRSDRLQTDGELAPYKDASALLIEEAIALLDTANLKERQGIYDIISQFNVPLEAEERLLWRMEEKNDYKYSPLAARYALHQYDQNREGVWVKAQAERQERLRLFISGSPESAMKQFDESMKLAHKIVFSTDPHALPKGKVGMEFEGGDRFGLQERAGKISREWEVGFDMNEDYYLEVRKSDDRLDFSSYPSALVEVYAWAVDYFISDPYDRYRPRVDRTMHLHLDLKHHPRKPGWGLYDDELWKNNLGTWEMRAVLPFQTAAETLAFTELAIHSASTNEKGQSSEFLSVDGVTCWQQLVYGHIVHSTENTDARAAALVALRDPFAMRGFNLKPLLTTYGEEVLELLYRQPDDFLMPGSPSHYGELYALSIDHGASRDPQRLYDMLTSVLASGATLEMAVELISRDPLAHSVLAPHFLQLESANEDLWRAIWETERISLGFAELLLPAVLGNDSHIDSYPQQDIMEGLMERLIEHPDVFDRLISLLCDPEMSFEKRMSIIQVTNRIPALDGSILELLTRGVLPEEIELEIVQELHTHRSNRQLLIEYGERGLLSGTVKEWLDNQGE